jgi:hypothetical protein
LVIIAPEKCWSFRPAVPHELDRKKAWSAHCPENRPSGNRGALRGHEDGEDGVTGGFRAALAANQPLG